MHEFDITSLLAWQPMQVACINCRALHSDIYVFDKDDLLRCPSCGVNMRPEPSSSDYPLASFSRYSFELWINGPKAYHRPSHESLLAELLALAKDAERLRSSVTTPRIESQPQHWLFNMLQKAQLFIHVTSFSTISPRFLNELAFGSLRVPVYGIVGNPDPQTARRLATLNHIQPAFAIRPWAGRGPVPHHKLIIIDGLVALVGSANLTDRGWAKIPLGREYLEVVTRPAEVVRLNNALFAPCWAAMSPLANGETLDLRGPYEEPRRSEDDPPDEVL